MLWAVKTSGTAVAFLGGEPRQSLPHVLDHRFDEAGMVVEDAQLVDLRRFGADLGPGANDVVEILAATRVGAVGGRDESQRAADAVTNHRAQGIGQQRMPVPIAPIDRQVDPVGGELGLQGGNERAVVVVDRTPAVEAVVVLGDGEHALARDVAAPQHVLQEGDDVLTTFRPPEREDQQRVVVRGHARFGIGR